jgi:hypothetical protein
MDHPDPPCSHDQLVDSAEQAPKSMGAEFAAGAASVTVPLDAGSVDQGYRRADHQEAADEVGKATRSDVGHTASVEEQEGSQEVACAGHEESSFHWASVAQTVQNRSWTVDAQGGMRLHLAMAELGTRRSFRVAEAVGSRSVDDGTWAGIRGSCVAAAVEAGA